jgi:uncharacterized protein (TIGR01777 family)
MRVFVTGASGLIGGALVDRLLARGDQVTALARRPPAEARPGLSWVTGDVTGPGPWQEEVAGADAIIHLAGEPLDARRWSAEQKERLRHSRVAGTARVVEALSARPARPRLLLAASAVGIYGARGEEELDERAPPGTDFLAQLCQAWEAEARRASESGLRVVCLRTAVVLSARGGALARMRPAFALFAGGPLGDRRAWFPWIHEDDVIGLALHALDGQALVGPVNAVSPGIVRMEEFARELGRALHRPAWVPVPQLALRLLVGELATSLNPGMKVVPRAALAAGYQFRYPTLGAALAAALSLRT